MNKKVYGNHKRRDNSRNKKEEEVDKMNSNKDKPRSKSKIYTKMNADYEKRVNNDDVKGKGEQQDVQ